MINLAIPFVLSLRSYTVSTLYFIVRLCIPVACCAAERSSTHNVGLRRGERHTCATGRAFNVSTSVRFLGIPAFHC